MNFCCRLFSYFSSPNQLFSFFFFLLSFSLEAQLTAKFTSNKNSGCSPLTGIQFTDQSTPTGTITSWKWIFESNGQSVFQNPFISYSIPGTYDVTLIVGNGTTFDTLVKTDFIKVFASPSANFSSGDSAGCIPLTVSFFDLSVPSNTGIASWSWDFGDGAFSNLKNPSHLYTTLNTYTVVLQITDSNGCQSFKSFPNYVTTTAQPIAGFSMNGPTVACDTPFTVSFSNSSTGSGNLSYNWFFGDSSNSTEINPTHTYMDSGFFDVKLIVTDQNGCKDTMDPNVGIIIKEVTASFTMGKDTVCPGQNVIFSSSSQNALFFDWNFGDGIGISSVPSPSYKYLNPGNFLVTLIAFGPQGVCSDTITDSINVELTNAAFSVNTSFACDVPWSVQYINSSFNAVSWEWLLGNGDTSFIKNPTAVYLQEGIFNDTLIVTSPLGCKDTLIKPGDVKIFILKPDFSANITKGCIPLIINFANTTIPPDSIASYKWIFGDGTPNSSLQNPTHTYSGAGDFNVTLITTSVSGCKDTIVKQGFIQAGSPQIPNFSVDMDTICADTFFTFSDLSFNSLLVDEWHWIVGGYDTNGIPDPPFPGTEFSAVQNPTFNPVDTGYKYIKLRVGYNGCYDSLLLDSFIYINGPYISLASTFNCDTPFTYHFSLQDSLAIQRWHWDFGDGSPPDSINMNPTHTFNNSGDYTITDSTFNDTTGCKMAKTIDIKVRNIKAVFTTDTNIGCKPFLVLANGNQSQDEENSFQWNFGDSAIFSNGTYDTITAGPDVTHIFDKRGDIIIQLIVTDINGCKDTAWKTITGYKPFSYFSADTLTNCVPFFVDFSDSSKADTTIIGWNWSFGDGGIDSVQNPSYGYSSPGGKTVTLVVTDTLGCKDTLTKVNYVFPIQPFPDWTVSDATICFGSQVNFNNATTYPNSNILNVIYQWNFSNGQSSNQINPSIIFNDTGLISVTVLATDTLRGCDSSVTKNNFVHVQALPVADFASSTTFSPCYNPPDPPQILFYNKSITDYLDTLSWAFGDGTISILQGDTVGHAYTSPDTFDVQLIVQTTYGCIDTIIKPNYIIVVGPTAQIDVFPDTVCVGDVVSYAMINANNVGEYSWDFGDGSGAPGTNDTVTYSYKQVGYLFPKLIYSFAGGACQQIAVDTIFIHQVLAGFSVDTVVCRSVPNTFSNNSLGADSYKWNFGDGSPLENTPNPLPHTFKTEGVYLVSLAITNNFTGCKDTITKPVKVYFSCDSAECKIIAPQVSTIPDTSIIVGQEVTLYTTTQFASFINWSPSDSLSCGDCQNPVAQPSLSTKFIVTVKDENECLTDKDTVEIIILNEHKFDVPTAFTPNGDGINDSVFVRGWGIKNLTTFKIFNRWGQIIFETQDLKSGWDGNYKNLPQNSETYVYVVSVEYFGGTTESRKGYITLIR